jgi:hypothetical protein
MWTTAGSRKCRKRDAGTGRSGDHLDREGTPLVTNPEVLRGYALLFVIMAVLGAVISLVTGNIAILLFLFIPVIIGIIVLLVLVSLTMQLVTGGGLEIQGIVDAGGYPTRSGRTHGGSTGGYHPRYHRHSGRPPGRARHGRGKPHRVLAGKELDPRERNPVRQSPPTVQG